MKKIWICILLVAGLSACTSGGSGYENCSNDGDVCIWMHVEEPVLFGEVNTLTISVSSNIDIDNLIINLSSYPQILIEDTNGWVRYLNWEVDISAGQQQTFTKNILLPERNGYYFILSDAYTYTPQKLARHSFYIVQKDGTSAIYYAGTPIPHTTEYMSTLSPNVIQTLQAMPTITERPTRTPKPMKTSTPTSVPYPAAPTLPPGEGPIEEPYP